jgi:hypothetical protein
VQLRVGGQTRHPNPDLDLRARHGRPQEGGEADGGHDPEPVPHAEWVSRIRGDAPSQTMTAAAIPTALAVSAAGPLTD